MWFAKRPQTDPEALVQERWSSSFKWFQKRRLPEEQAPDYRTQMRPGGYLMEITKRDCFAWATAPYKYRDFLLEAGVGIEPGNGHCAAGFVFRYINEENFYYFLVSDRGSFRFDVVFNKNPIHLIDWTRSPLLESRPLELRVIARGDGFFFFADDEWIAEMSDATIAEGAVGFAAQNYSEADRGRFRLLSLTLESRPLEVEKAYFRWVHYVPARPERRIELARTFHGMGRHLEAAVELRKAFRMGAGSAEEHRLLADACKRLKLYPDALEALDRSLALEPEHGDALLEKANLLVLANRFLEARSLVVSILSRFAENPVPYTLLGNCEYSLGNWEQAREAYGRAVELGPEVAVYRSNLARTQERLGLEEEALRSYLEAARLLFCQEAYDELSFVLARGGKLARKLDSAEGRELSALEAKMLFHEDKKAEAELLLRELIRQDHPDSGVHYLYALLLIGRGSRAEAEEHLNKALELEPSFPLYWFRLAENRFLLGNDPREPLERAYALDPEDAWINNLKGQILLEQGKAAEALPYFEKALAKAPAEAPLYRNAAAALLELGRAEEAVRLATTGLEKAGDKPELRTMRGNCRARLRDFASALADYEKALELDPDNPDYLANSAACCLELDMILRAEELLNRLMEIRPGATAHNLTGNLAVVQGDELRAELAFQEGLKLEPENADIALNLASLYLSQGGYAKCRGMLEPLLIKQPGLLRAQELQRQMRERFEQRLACDGCLREWWIPKEVPPQSAFRVRGEPPGEAPAGRCERCGKLFCIACASEHVREGQLCCPSCGGRLRLSDDPLKYLFLRFLEP